MINAKFKIITSNAQIERSALKECEREVKQILAKAKAKIHADLINLVIEALSTCPEIISLQGGKLKQDFGLSSDPTTDIVYAVANSVVIDFKNFTLSKLSKAALTVYIQPDDFMNLLSRDFATVVTEKGQILPWLQWLLIEGDRIIISEYHVEYGVYPSSRSGEAIMKPGRIFKVDSSFSGNKDDNFITRALSRYESQIKDIIGNSI